MLHRCRDLLRLKAPAADQSLDQDRPHLARAQHGDALVYPAVSVRCLRRGLRSVRHLSTVPCLPAATQSTHSPAAPPCPAATLPNRGLCRGIPACRTWAPEPAVPLRAAPAASTGPPCSPAPAPAPRCSDPPPTVWTPRRLPSVRGSSPPSAVGSNAPSAHRCRPPAGSHATRRLQ